jgi:hypothetical protein
MNVTEIYLDKCAAIIEKIKAQQNHIQQVAHWFAESILAGRVVHCGQDMVLFRALILLLNYH